MAEVIITEFRAETAQFVASIDKAEAAVIGLDKAEEDAEKSTRGLSQQLGSSAAKANAHRAAMGEVSKNTAKATTETNKLGKSIKDTGAAAPALNKIGTAAKKAGSDIGSATKATGDLGGKIKDVAAQSAPAVDGIGGSFLRLLGPIGLIGGAIGGAFLALFRNTDAGATAIEGFGRGASFTFDRITGLAKRFAESLSGLFVNSDGEANAFIATLTKVGDKFLDILTLGATSAIRDSLLEDQAAGKAIADQLDEIQDKQLGVNEATAKNEITIRKNLAALRDITKPLEERLRLADQITTVEKENLRIQREQLKEELKLALLEAKIIESRKDEVDDDLKARISGIKTAVFNLEAESVSLTERVAARRAGIVEEEEQRKRTAREKSVAEAARAQAKSLADAEKAAAAQKKAEADRLKLEADTLAAENEIAGIRTAIAAADLSDIQKRDAAVRASFEKQIEVARAAFAKLSDFATTDEDRAEIARRQSAVVLELAAAETAELERLRQQDIEGVRDHAKSKEEIEIAAINKKFDLQAKETERLITSEEERTAILVQIEKDRQAALLGVRIEADTQRLAQQQAAQDAELNAIGAFAQASAALVAGFAAGQEDAAKNFAKSALSIAFDAIQAMVPIWTAQATAASLVQPDSIATFGTAGLARAAVLTALIQGVLQGLRSTLGFADGGEVTKRSGPAVRRSNGDNVIATLQDREIVLSRASRARAERMFGKGVWGDLGVPGFGGSTDWTSALARIQSANGPRDGGTAVVQHDDRRLIGALGGVGSLREQRRQTELLEELARTRGRNPRSRWA